MIALWLLVAASLVAALTDLRTRRIPNALTFGLAAAALVLAASGGLSAFVAAFVSYAVVLVIGTFPHTRGWIGGGDVKLLAAGSACMAWPLSLTFFLYVALAGGVLAIAQLAQARQLRAAMMQLATAAYVGGLQRGVILEPSRPKLPYALAIAAGALLLLASETIAPWLQLARA